jgi:putative acetyltransferase
MKIPEDLGRVKEIWLKGAKEAHKEFISLGFWDSVDICKEIQNMNERYVYEENNIIKGFITARALENPPKTAYLAEMYINSNFQRQGIGTLLFETLQGKNDKFPQLERRYSQFSSHVYAHNHQSIAWHIKNKFKITGIHFCPLTGLPKFEMIWKQ